jgi:hypothetical protein
LPAATHRELAIFKSEAAGNSHRYSSRQRPAIYVSPTGDGFDVVKLFSSLKHGSAKRIPSHSVMTPVFLLQITMPLLRFVRPYVLSALQPVIQRCLGRL